MTEVLLEVHLRQIPVALWMRAREHTDELFREFALIALAVSEPDQAEHVPARLTALAAELNRRYAPLTVEQEAQLTEAAQAGQEYVDDLVFRVPADAGAAAAHLDELLDLADDYCRAGRHLLTLAAAEEVTRFRRWYLGQFAGQLRGAAPVPWPDREPDPGPDRPGRPEAP